MKVPRRARLGVALLVDNPTGIEVSGLRRALGDANLESLAPHITLVPPINVKETELPRALAVLRDAASSVSGPFELTLGPPSTFLPENPVCYLGVHSEGDALGELRTVRDAVFAEPLSRKLSWPWVPHVTILDGGDPRRIGEAVSCLGSYRVTASFDRLVMLELGADRTWRPRADALLGRRVRVATGGLALDVSFSRLPDAELPTIVPTLGSAGDHRLGADRLGPGWAGAGSLVAPVFVAVRREGSLCGVAGAWVDMSGPFVAVWVDPANRRQGIGATLLGQLEARLRREGWRFERLSAHGPAGFFERRSSWCVADRWAEKVGHANGMEV